MLRYGLTQGADWLRRKSTSAGSPLQAIILARQQQLAQYTTLCPKVRLRTPLYCRHGCCCRSVPGDSQTIEHRATSPRAARVRRIGDSSNAEAPHVSSGAAAAASCEIRPERGEGDDLKRSSRRSLSPCTRQRQLLQQSSSMLPSWRARWANDVLTEVQNTDTCLAPALQDHRTSSTDLQAAGNVGTIV